MTRLIAAEFRKLTTTRSTYLLLAAVATVAAITVLDPGHDAATFEKPFHEQMFVLFTALLSRVLIVILGIRAMTDEFRHGTVVSSLLVTPRRERVVAAKAVAVGVVGAVLGLVAWSSMTSVAAVVAATDGATLELGMDGWRTLVGMIGGGALWGLVGVGLGTVIRSQIAATVGALVWLMGIEDGIRGWLGDLAGYLPGQAGLAMAISPGGGPALTAALTLLAYAALFLGAGLAAVRRDVV